jgi:hypothetical protein
LAIRRAHELVDERALALAGPDALPEQERNPRRSFGRFGCHRIIPDSPAGCSTPTK